MRAAKFVHSCIAVFTNLNLEVPTRPRDAEDQKAPFDFNVMIAIFAALSKQQEWHAGRWYFRQMILSTISCNNRLAHASISILR